MKRIIIVLLFLSSIGLAQKKGHENLNINCATCHACENPTKSDPCLVECPRLEMVTVRHSAEEGPGAIVMDNFKGENDLYGPVEFSHKVHAEMADMAGGCEMCHHYNPPGGMLACSQCHEKERNREDIYKPDLKGAFHQQCMACHKEWNQSGDCNECHAPKGVEIKTADAPEKRVHPEIVEPGRVVYETPEFDGGSKVTFYHDQHTGLFKLECRSCHENESCATCHGAEKVSEATLSMEEKHEKCADCHDVEDDCASCHMEEVAPEFNHAKATGFALTGNHAGLKCEKCHGETGFKGLNDNCSSCHSSWTVDNFNHEVTGMKLMEPHDEMDCESCHQDGNYSKPTCDMCHEDITYPDIEPGEWIKK